MKTTDQYLKTVSFERTYRFSIQEIKKEVADAIATQYGISTEAILHTQTKEIKALRQEVNELKVEVKESRETTAKLVGLIMKFLNNIPGVKNRKLVAKQVADNLLAKKLKPEIEIGGLATYADGTIRFKGSVIPMRDQLNDLCRMFMSRPNQLVLCDEIREEIVRADRRETTTFITIAKYVSELHGLLKPCFGKNVILNHKKEGWRFVP